MRPNYGQRVAAFAAVAAFFLLAQQAAPAKTAHGPMPPEMTRILNEPITSGNFVEVLVGGPEYYPRRLEMIKGAKESIDLMMFLWCDDVSGIEIARELAKAARRGVRVRVVVDYFNDKRPAQVYRILRQAGIDLFMFNPLYAGWRVNDRVHEKIMLVDGQTALLGGANLCDEYMLETAKRGLWQDYEIFVEGPGSIRIQDSFDETWRWMRSEAKRTRGAYAAVTPGRPPRYAARRHEPASRGQAIEQEVTQPALASTGEPGARVLFHHQRPYSDRDATDVSFILYGILIESAKSRVVIHTPYMSPPPRFKEVLIAAAARGVTVQILTNSPETNDLFHAFALAARHRYRRLIEQGIQIFESPKETLHGKAIVVDDRLSAVGSHNFTRRSFLHNGEVMVVTDDPRVAERLSMVFNGNMDKFTEVSETNLPRKEPRGLRRLVGALAGFFL